MADILKIQPASANARKRLYEFTDRPWHIEPGEYKAYFVNCSIEYIYYGYKLYIQFQIKTESGEKGFLVKHYAIRKPDEAGNFLVGSRSDLCRDYCRLACLNHHIVGLSLKDIYALFSNKVFKVEVTSVISDSKGRPLAVPSQYSKIDYIVAEIPLN